MTGRPSTGSGTVSTHHAPRPKGRSWPRGLLRGLWALLLLALSAADHMISALLGRRPFGPRIRAWFRVWIEEYRAGAAGYIDAEVVDDTDD